MSQPVLVRAVRVYPDACKRGHLFTVANTRVTDRGRICLACERLRRKEHNDRKRAAKKAASAA